MKLNDIIGFAAILGAGSTIGYNSAPGQSFAALDYIIIAVLLAIGFYFSVILS